MSECSESIAVQLRGNRMLGVYRLGVWDCDKVIRQVPGVRQPLPGQKLEMFRIIVEARAGLDLSLSTCLYDLFVPVKAVSLSADLQPNLFFFFV